MPLYAYCLGDEVAARMLEDVTGVGGAKPHLVRHGEICVVVSNFEGETVSVTRENVFGHERVIQRVLRFATPLPFRFGTLVSDGRLEAFIHEHSDALRKNLERVRDSVEMSVKIIWDAAEEGGAPAFESGGGQKPEAPTLGKGAAYLAARRREILGDELLKERAAEITAWLTERIGSAAKDCNVRVRTTESLVVRAAYLVRRAALSDYQERVERVRRERPKLRFLTSGPWPPYSFSNIKP